jgi:hypothetical protein
VRPVLATLLVATGPAAWELEQIVARFIRAHPAGFFN